MDTEKVLSHNVVGFTYLGKGVNIWYPVTDMTGTLLCPPAIKRGRTMVSAPSVLPTAGRTGVGLLPARARPGSSPQHQQQAAAHGIGHTVYGVRFLIGALCVYMDTEKVLSHNVVGFTLGKEVNMIEALLPLIPMAIFVLFPSKEERMSWKAARQAKKARRAAFRTVARSGAIRY